MERISSLVLVALILPGCSWLTPPIARPIIEDHAQRQINTFAIQPSRRMLIVKSNINQNGDAGNLALKNGLLADRAIVLCAEASPDVSDDIFASLAAAASASGPFAHNNQTANAGASLAQALATSSQNLFKRSQALQLYRDAAYHLCQAKLNGYISDPEFKDALEKSQETAARLMELEIPWLYMGQILSPSQVTSARESLQRSVSIESNGKVKIEVPGIKSVVEMPKADKAEAPAAPPPPSNAAGEDPGK